MYKTVEIDCSRIRSFDDFHTVFMEMMGFPNYYGRNMNAWIDCMTFVDNSTECTKVNVDDGEFLVLVLNHIDDMIAACPQVYEALVDDTAFVNFRRMEVGESPVLALSYFANPNR